MSRFRLALLTAGALAVAAAAVITWRLHLRRSPLYSLRQLADGARSKDRAAIERYLDVGRTAESVVDEAIATAGGLEIVDPSMKPSLVSGMQQTIWTTLIDSLATLEDRYQGLADVRQQGGVARVGVRIRAEDGDAVAVVHLRMERADGHWRVVGVEDLGPYLRASLARRLERAYEAAMRSDLRNLVTAQAMYFASHMTYAPSLRALTYPTTTGVSVEIVEAHRDGWRAVARHQRAGSECRIAIGTAVPPGDVAGQPKCLAS